MSADAAPVPSSEERPTDLIPLQAAARQVDRARTTIRGWITAGTLRSWRDGTDRNSPVLVSLAELRLLAASGGLAPEPPRPPPAPSVLQERQTQELAALQARLKDMERIEAEAELLKQTVSDLRGSIQDLRLAVERERVRADSAEAEVQTLRAAQGLPWWRRLLPG
jgi:hypothetical protein